MGLEPTTSALALLAADWSWLRGLTWEEHVHGMNHGGLSPSLVADVASDKELREEAMAALATQVQADLPLAYHAIYLAQRRLRIAARRDVAHDVPTPPPPRDAWQSDAAFAAERKEHEGEYVKYLSAWIAGFHAKHPQAEMFARIANECKHARRRKSIAADRLQYETCRDEVWWPTFLHHVHLCVMNKHSHEHCTSPGLTQCPDRHCARCPVPGAH